MKFCLLLLLPYKFSHLCQYFANWFWVISNTFLNLDCLWINFWKKVFPENLFNQKIMYEQLFERAQEKNSCDKILWSCSQHKVIV